MLFHINSYLSLFHNISNLEEIPSSYFFFERRSITECIKNLSYYFKAPLKVNSYYFTCINQKAFECQCSECHYYLLHLAKSNIY